jgi:anaerobic selenocysteine-containing dehydrogenase
MGMPITFGVQNAEHEAKDWANSRFLLIVGANPVDTRIPDATSSSTRRARGTAGRGRSRSSRVRPPRPTPGCRSGRAPTPRSGSGWHVILDEELGRPRLRAHLHRRAAAGQARHRRRLRERDLRAGGSDARYVVWDERTGGSCSSAPSGSGCRCGAGRPWPGRTASPWPTALGEVAPGWSSFVDEVETWTMDPRAPEVTGLSAETIRRVARLCDDESPRRSSWGAARTTGSTAT